MTSFIFKDTCIASPLDQLAQILDHLHFSITNIGLYLTITPLITLPLYIIAINCNKVVANNWFISIESIYATVHSIVLNQINAKNGQVYFPFIFALFLYILINNLIGMVPYSFASTSHFILTFSISFTVVLGATILSFIKHGLKFFSLFVPAGCPLALLPLLHLLNRAYDYLKCGLSCPPKPHSFVCLPLQSMPVLPMEILMNIGPYIEYESVYELIEIVGNVFNRLTDIESDYLFCTWEGDDTYTLPQEIIDEVKRDFISEESRRSLDIVKDNIHKLAKNERHLRTLNIQGNLFRNTYHYIDIDGNYHNSNIIDMIRSHEFWVAETNKMVLRELPFSQC